MKKFTRPSFWAKEFYALKMRKSRLFLPAINSENASLSVIWLKLNKMWKFFNRYEESLPLAVYKLAKYVRNCVVFWRNLHSWQIFYTTAGHDKLQVWGGAYLPSYIIIWFLYHILLILANIAAKIPVKLYIKRISIYFAAIFRWKINLQNCKLITKHNFFHFKEKAIFVINVQPR